MFTANNYLSLMRVALAGHGAKLLLRLLALSLACMCAILLMVPTAAGAAPLTGTYKITDSVDSGNDVHLTLQLNFVNAGDTPVTVTSLGVRTLFAPGHLVSAPISVVVEAHGSAQASVEFSISKQDFELWSLGPHQAFLVRHQVTGGKWAVANVLLLRTKG